MLKQKGCGSSEIFSLWKFRYAGLILVIAEGSVTMKCKTSKVTKDVLLWLLWGFMKDPIRKKEKTDIKNVVSVCDASDHASKVWCCSLEVWLLR